MAYQPPPEIFLIPRQSLGILLAVRSKHRDLIAYHRRFEYTEVEMCYSCGLENSFEHPFFASSLGGTKIKLENLENLEVVILERISSRF